MDAQYKRESLTRDSARSSRSPGAPAALRPRPDRASAIAGGVRGALDRARNNLARARLLDDRLPTALRALADATCRLIEVADRMAEDYADGWAQARLEVHCG